MLFLQRLQLKDARAAHQRVVHLEVRVFRSGPDEGDRPVLHVRQQGVLLGRVEAMHLVDEQDGARLVVLEAIFGLLDGLAEVVDAGEHRIERGEVRLGGVGDDAGEGRLARPRRAVKENRRHPIRLDGAAEKLALANEVLLPHKLVERTGAHAISQRRPPLSHLFSLCVKKVSHCMYL